MSGVGGWGPWDEAALRRTVDQYWGLGTDFELSDDVRFLAGVSNLIQRRLNSGEVDHAGASIAVFLRQPAPMVPPDGLNLQRFPMLDNGLVPVSGRLWFVNKVANFGLAMELGDRDDDQVFRLAVEELGMGSVQAVVLDTRTSPPEARHYRTGLANPEDCAVIRLATGPISIDEIMSALDRLYNQHLVTPDAQGNTGSLWQDADKGYPIKNAEAAIAVVARAVLTGAFPTCVVQVEQPQPTGRVDLVIVERMRHDPSLTRNHAVLELKVLRSFGSTGRPYSATQTDNWIRDGVVQASAYRTDRGALLAALCCFDMRVPPQGDICFEHVRALAEAQDVHLRCWMLFSSSKLYRDHFTQRSSQDGAVASLSGGGG